MSLSIYNNNTLVAAKQETNPITINLPSAADMSSVALAAATRAETAAATVHKDYADFDSFITSTDTYSAGDLVTIDSIGAVYKTVSGTGNLGQTNAGGQEFDVLPDASGVVNVNAFGAVSVATSPTVGTDNAAAFQAAFNTDFHVIIPAGSYRVSTATITQQKSVRGGGMGETIIYPITGSSTFIIATDHVEISDIEFRGQTGTGQANVTGDCILCDAVTSNASFTRPMEGVKIERCKFRKLKMNGINIAQPLRESIIRNNRFVGMGDAASSRAPIKGLQTLGSPSTINNLWIEGNMFYGYATPAIYFLRSTLISSSASASYATLYITNNLIHGQLLDESLGVEPVQPEETHSILIQDVTDLLLAGNKVTSIHPVYSGVRLVNNGTACDASRVIGNTFAVASPVAGVTYNVASGNATGEFVYVSGANGIVCTNNTMNAGVFTSDMTFAQGSLSGVNINVDDNVSSNGSDIIVDSTGMGAWFGRISTNSVFEDDRIGTFFNTLNSQDIIPRVTDVYDLGTASLRFDRAFIKTVRFGPSGAQTFTSGSGSPEGVLAATVGSIYTRTDGGTGTTLYIKESGGGNTGWVAK